MSAARTGARGVTLVELVVVITLVGVVASLSATLVSRVASSQQDNRGRLVLAQSADGTVARIADELQAALPNSLRLVASTNSFWLEWAPVNDAGRYRANRPHAVAPIQPPFVVRTESVPYYASVPQALQHPLYLLIAVCSAIVIFFSRIRSALRRNRVDRLRERRWARRCRSGLGRGLGSRRGGLRNGFGRAAPEHERQGDQEDPLQDAARASVSFPSGAPAARAASTAARASTMPQPCRSTGTLRRRFAVRTRIDFTSNGRSFGLASSICAATLDTMGAAKLVPSTCL